LAGELCSSDSRKPLCCAADSRIEAHAERPLPFSFRTVTSSDNA